MTRLAAIALLALAAATGAEGADPTALFARHCAVCHGEGGAGDGPAAGLLEPRPRDFSTGTFKFRSTPTGASPTLDDVATTIRRGLRGTSMPGYGDHLSADEIEALARYVIGLAPRRGQPGAPLRLGPPPPDTPATRARGAALYAAAGCGSCHDADGRGAGWRPEREGPGGLPRPTDLSEPWTFRGGSDAGSVARRILTGLDGSPMPAYADALAPADAWAIARHVATLARRPAWEESRPAAIRTAGVAPDPLDRGRYLVNAMLCPLCHTPISARTGAYDTGRFLGGGMRVSAYPWGVWYSRNLTPDRASGLGAWSEAEIVTAVTRGIARDGRRLDPMAMPWPWFARLTAADARAIAVYLKALPPVANPVPPAERIAWPEAVGGKLLALLGREVAVEFWGGNAGADPARRGGVPVSLPTRAVAHGLGWTTLAGALLVVGRGLRSARRGRWWGAGGLGLLAWAALAVWPPLGVMSPELTTWWLFRGTPPPAAEVDGAARAWVERGRYLATVAPCGLCHTPAGAFVGFYTDRTLAGGMEGRWQVYGRATSTNLTPHPRDGIGGLTDAAFVRAARSGIGRDGRRMHWQAMPWDITSRWSEEDLRAILAYLRTLPPVPGAIPPPRLPGPGDPPADAFYFGDAAARR